MHGSKGLELKKGDKSAAMSAICITMRKYLLPRQYIVPCHKTSIEYFISTPGQTICYIVCFVRVSTAACDKHHALVLTCLLWHGNVAFSEGKAN